MSRIFTIAVVLAGGYLAATQFPEEAAALRSWGESRLAAVVGEASSRGEQAAGALAGGFAAPRAPATNAEAASDTLARLAEDVVQQTLAAAEAAREVVSTVGTDDAPTEAASNGEAARAAEARREARASAVAEPVSARAIAEAEIAAPAPSVVAPPAAQVATAPAALERPDGMSLAEARARSEALRALAERMELRALGQLD